MENNQNFGITVQAMLDVNAGQTLQASLDKLTNLKINLNIDGSKIKGIENVKNNISSYGSSLKETEASTNGLNSSVNSLIGNVGKVAAWSMATNAIYGTKQALEELFENIVTIESKLVELERVTANIDIQKVFDGALESSQKYGADLLQTLDAITEIGRSYDNLNEEQIIATSGSAVLATTIADMDGSEAVKTIISVSNAYHLLIENSELLIDMINEVDNKYAVSSQTISEALRKSSATAGTFGVELENLIGYITAISVTTQESGNVIGNSLKTILSRLTTMSGVETVLDDINISIRDNVGNMRNSTDILGDLASKWGTLTDEQQQNIGVQVAGRYQLTRFLALMENYDIALKSTATAMGSQGSAARENAVYLNSYEAKLTQLENAQLGLAKAVGDSSMNEFGKAFIDARTTLTEAATAVLKFSDATTILVTSLVGLTIALSRTSNGKKLLSQITGVLISQEQQEANASLRQAQAASGQVSILDKLNNLFNLKTIALKNSQKATDLYTLATNKTELAQKKLALAEQRRNEGRLDLASKHSNVAAGLTSEAQAAQTAAVKFKAMGIAAQVAGTLVQAAFTLGIGIIIGAVVNGINSLIQANQKAAEAAIESGNELKNWGATLKQNVTDIEKYRTALSSTNLTTDEATSYKESLIEIEQGLIDKYGEEAEQLDLVNGKLEEQIALISKLSQQDAQKWLNENQKAINNAQEKLGSTKGSYETMYGGGSYKQASLFKDVATEQGLSASVKKQPGWSETSVYGKPEELIEYWTKLSEYVQKSKDEVKELYGLNDAQIQEVLNDAGSNITKLNEKYGEHIEVLKLFGENSLAASDDYYKFIAELEQGAQDGELTKEQIQTLLNSHEGLAEAFEKAGISLDDLSRKYEVLPALISAADDASIEYIRNHELLNTEVEKLNSNLDNMQNAYDTVSGAIQQFNETGYLTIDTMQSLLALDDKYLVNLIDKNGNLQLNEQSYRNLTDAMLDEAEASALNQAMLELDTINANQDRDAIENLRLKYGDLKTKLEEVGLTYDYVKNKAIEYKAVEGISTEDVAVIDKIMGSLNSKIAIINKTRSSINKSVAKTISSTSSKSTAKEKTYFDYVNERLDKFKDNLDSLDLELKIVQEKFKLLPEGSRAWLDNLDLQESLIKKNQQAINNYINAIRNELMSNQLTYDERVKLNNLLQQQTLEYEKQNTALSDLIDTEKDYYKSQIKKQIDLIKDLENQRHEEVIDNIKKEREAFKKAIENQISLIKKAEDARKFDKEIDKLQSEKQSVQEQINRLQGDNSRLANTRRIELEKQLVDIEDQILENQIERQNDLREEALSNLETQKMDELDIYENAENAKHELILNNLEARTEALDELNLSISELNNQMSELANILNSFPNWSDTFNLAAGVQNLNSLFGTLPVTTNNTNPNSQMTQTFVINVTANTKAEGQVAGQAIIDELMKNGIITSGNGF